MEEQVLQTTIAQPQEKVSKLFSWSYASAMNGGPMLAGAVISTYFALFMTDTMLLPAAAASLVMFISTLWDAISDPIMGVIADRTNTKWGRYRPYFVPAPILFTFFATMLWVNPDFSTTGKFIYILIIYIGYAVSGTMYTMPHMALLPAAVRDNEQRNKIIALSAGMMALMFTIGSTFTTTITSFFENMGFGNGFIPLMLICGILSFISFWTLFKTSKERYLTKIENTSIKQDLKRVLRHKELTPFLVVWLMASVGYGLMFSSSVYYVMYYIERPDLIPLYMGIVSIGALVSMMVLMPIVLKIFKTGQRALMFTQVGAIICYTLLFFFGKSSLTFLYVMTFVASSIASMQNALVNVLVNDAIDYIQFKEGISANGLIASIKLFAQKTGNTITNSGILALLAISGYIAGAIGNQPESTMTAINFLRFGAPTITAVILLVALRFNPVEKHYEDIEEMKNLMKSKAEED